jgi:hypothetical protein
MQHNKQTLFRKEAIEFQRRRLAGEVHLSPNRGMVIMSLVVLVATALSGVMAWNWSVPVLRNYSCEYRTEPRILIRVSAAEITNEAPILRAMLQSPKKLALKPSQIVTSNSLSADANCNVVLEFSMYPLRQAINRAMRR